MGEAGTDGHGWLWSGAVPGTAPGCRVWECSAQKGRVLIEHVWAH